MQSSLILKCRAAAAFNHCFFGEMAVNESSLFIKKI